MNLTPIRFIWNDDGVMAPASKLWARKCDERFVVGMEYPLEEVHQRSSASHAHYFATLHEIWLSLPEHLAAEFQNEEQLRKTALIRTGFHTKVQHVCKSAAEAERLGAVIRPYDAYQIVMVEGVVVTVYHAMSQDHRSMDRTEFAKSKDAVLGWCANLIEVEAKTLETQGADA